MAISITHPFVSGKADGVDSTLVQPSNWNAGHTVTGSIDPGNGGKPTNRYTNFVGFSPATTATTAMMGLAAGANPTVLTPATTGRVKVTFCGTLGNLTAAGGADLWIAYGTGTAPANGAASTGTTMTTLPVTAFQYLTGANIEAPFCYIAEVGSLTLSTQYWFDVSLSAENFASAFVKVASVIIEEF